MTYSIEAYTQTPKAENSNSDKLVMEATLLGGGIAQGVKSRVSDFVSNPVENIYESGKIMVGTGAVGYLTSRYAPRLAAPLLGAVAIADSIPALKSTKEAIAETWAYPSTYEKNKNKVADGLGRKVFDLALYSAAALGGITRGRHELSREELRWRPQEELATLKPAETHFPKLVHDPTAYQSDYMTIKQVPLSKDSPLTAIYKSNADSVVRVRGTRPQGDSVNPGAGTGFFVDGGLIITNHHVIKGDMLNTPTAILRSGERINLELVAHDRAADLALLKVVPPFSGKPVSLGSSAALEFGSPLHTVGHHYDVSRAMGSSGSYLETVQYKYLHSIHGAAEPASSAGLFIRSALRDGRFRYLALEPRPLEAKVVRQNLLRSDFPGYPGGSGSPVFDQAGKVVGVYSLKGDSSGAISVEHVKALVDSYKANKPSSGWLKVITHAEPESNSVKVMSVRNFVPRPGARTNS